ARTSTGPGQNDIGSLDQGTDRYTRPQPQALGADIGDDSSSGFAITDGDDHITVDGPALEPCHLPTQTVAGTAGHIRSSGKDDARSFDNGDDIAACGQSQTFDAGLGDNGSHAIAATDIQTHFGIHRAMLQRHDTAMKLVASAGL